MTTKRKPQRAAAPATTNAPCMDCGSPMVSRRETHRFPLFGDLAVDLVGVEVRRCSSPKCGYYGVAIEQPEALARTVAAALTRKRSRLAGDEIAYLRARLGGTGAELAKALGVTKGTVSRWENGHEKIGATPDHLLRALVMLHDGGEPAAFEVLSHLEVQGGDAPIKLTLRRGGATAWEVARAA